jgi:uncharacterized protein YneF (UPF0154 family)
MHYVDTILITVLTITSGTFLGLYLAKRKHYNDLVLSNRMDDERRWTDEQFASLYRHLNESKCSKTKGNKIPF